VRGTNIRTGQAKECPAKTGSGRDQRQGTEGSAGGAAQFERGSDEDELSNTIGGEFFEVETLDDMYAAFDE
jgi:hypothetical protein